MLVMRISVLGGLRKDARYKVVLFYPGGPNGFGGNHYGRSFTKLLSYDQLVEQARQADSYDNLPASVATAISEQAPDPEVYEPDPDDLYAVVNYDEDPADDDGLDSTMMERAQERHGVQL